MEIIAVVAVIGLLAALLFPSLQNVRHKAKEAACMSQLRNISAGMFVYAVDHDGKIPPGYDVNLGYAWNWQTSLMPYIGVGKWPGPKSGVQRNVYLCTELPPYEVGKNEHGGYVMPRRRWNDPAWPPMTAIPHPAKTVMLFEGPPTTPSLYIHIEQDLDNLVQYRHLGKTLLLLTDGHVQAEERENIDLQWFGIP